LGLAALIIVRGIVKIAVQTGVRGTIARRTPIAKTDSSLLLDLDLTPAVKALHKFFSPVHFSDGAGG
jgi:hypothetical protein